MLTRWIAAGATLASVAWAGADVTLPALISDNMVVQRETEVTIWGWADAGERVSVKASWAPVIVETAADGGGRWSVGLPTGEAGGPHTLTITGSGGARSIANVMVGEVWVCSGQSNMEWPMVRARDGAAEIAAADHPSIRLFNVPRTVSMHGRIDTEGGWSECSPGTVGSFSAVAYFFARHLQDELGVPVGLVGSNWGGTVAEAWTDPETLRAGFPEFAGALDMMELMKDPERRAEATRGTEDAWWRSMDARAPKRPAGGWTGIDFDDSGWATMTLPATLAGDEFENFDGFVYFRRGFALPAGATGRAGTLTLGPIDDRDEVWLNGKLVGGTRTDGQWSRARSYAIPSGVLLGGGNVVAIRMLDTGGPGGINGEPAQMVLEVSSGDADHRAPLAGEWRYHRGASMGELPPMQAPSRFGPNSPSALYNGMIAPLTSYTIRGAIWYQGESNRTRAAQYRRLFPAMIGSWRRAWGIGDFPFYFVQIAPFHYNGDTGQAGALREAQMLAQSVPNTGMAVTMDIGNPRDIHPTNKQDVGMRLALWALAQTYGRDDLVCSGPAYESLTIEGGSARVRFANVDTGLVARGGDPTHFSIAGADMVFHEADAEIDGATVVVSSRHVPAPVAVRYGWADAAQPNLFNGAGLPSSSFRTDDWDVPFKVIRHPDESGRREEGFTPLFNGRDLDGWANVNCAPSTWRAEDGVIKCTGLPTGVLRTTRQYENFVLELEWRHLRAGGNAGVFVWSDPVTVRGQPFTRSVEVQVLDGHEGPGHTSDGDVFPIHGATMTPVNGRGGARAFPTEARSNPSPHWNHYRIECVDGSISLAVNGKVVTRGSGCSPRKGYICLESEGSPVEFRDIVIKELPASGGLSAADIADLDDGFESLYTGVDFAGWKHGPEHEGHWVSRDWRIGFDGAGTDLWSEREFGDFELICDWRWAGPAEPVERPVILASGLEQRDADGNIVNETVQEAGDSGIYLRGSSKSQVNIWCWGCGSGEVYGYRTDSSMSPEVRAGVTPRVNADAPLGSWNRFRIRMVGERLTVVLNGQTVIDGARLPGVAARGPIALQRHGSPIEFANVYVRELE